MYIVINLFSTHLHTRPGLDALFTAMEEVDLKEGLLLTDHEREEVKRNNKIINILPVYQWLLEL